MSWPKGQPRSEKTKAKLRLVLAGRRLAPEFTDETREKIRCATIGNKRRWAGGRKKDRLGYVLVFMPGHPQANCCGYIYEHRLVMEAHLGRALLPSERVHHINEKRDDNRIENLMLFASTTDHLRFHREERSMIHV
jgi:hypothetical protein